MREKTHCCHMGYSFRLAARVLLYALSHRQDNTQHALCYTSCGALAGMRYYILDAVYPLSQTTSPTCAVLPVNTSPVSTGQLSDRSLMVDPLSYFSFQPVLHDWCNKCCGMHYPVCGIMHIKETLLLIGRNSQYGSMSDTI